MKKKVVVENTLEDIKNYLGQKGYDVRTMYRNDTLNDITSNEYEAIIVSDVNNGNLPKNLKGNTSIIEAAGLTPEQVYETIRNKVRF